MGSGIFSRSMPSGPSAGSGKVSDDLFTSLCYRGSTSVTGGAEAGLAALKSSPRSAATVAAT